MKPRKSKRITVDPLATEAARIDRAVKSAVRGAVLEHKRAGRAVVGSIDGRVAWVKPTDITQVYATPRVAKSKPRKAG